MQKSKSSTRPEGNAGNGLNSSKSKGTGAERDNGARGRCTGAREGAGRGPGQSAITVHGDGARVHGKVQEGDRGRAR